MKHKLIRALLALFLLAAGFPVFGNGFVSEAITDYGVKITDLSFVMMFLCVFFFVLVVGVIGYCLWKFRATGPGQEGAKIHGFPALEIVWTVVPALIMLWLGAISSVLVIQQLNPPAQTLLIKVTGYQFGFNFEYFDSNTVFDTNSSDIKVEKNICGNPAVSVKIKSLNVKTTDDFTIPKGTDIRFLTTAKDVIHSFWVPEFLVKRDMVPGLVGDFWINAVKTGDFTAKCAALCGASHGVMVAKLHVVEKQDFETWLAAQAAASPQAN